MQAPAFAAAQHGAMDWANSAKPVAAQPAAAAQPTAAAPAAAAAAPAVAPASSTSASTAKNKKAPISYAAERVIGTGSFGVVYEASVLETGERCAIKKVLQVGMTLHSARSRLK